MNYRRRSIASLSAFCGLLSLGASGCSKVNCDKLCERVRRCEPQISQALVARQPAKSPFMTHVRKQMPERTVKPLIQSCTQRCDKLRNSKKWRQRLQRCTPIKECAAFARCIAPALEP